MPHANAPLTPARTQRLAALIVDAGHSTRRAADRFAVSAATASKWATRYRAGDSFEDRSSRPHHSPHRLGDAASIASSLSGSRASGGRIASATTSVFRVPRSNASSRDTGCRTCPSRSRDRARPETPDRALREAGPGELVHVDIKKLGRIPDGGGWRTHGRAPVKTAGWSGQDRAAWSGGPAEPRIHVSASRRR